MENPITKDYICLPSNRKTVADAYGISQTTFYKWLRVMIENKRRKDAGYKFSISESCKLLTPSQVKELVEYFDLPDNWKLIMRKKETAGS